MRRREWRWNLGRRGRRRKDDVLPNSTDTPHYEDVPLGSSHLVQHIPCVSRYRFGGIVFEDTDRSVPSQVSRLTACCDVSVLSLLSFSIHSSTKEASEARTVVEQEEKREKVIE